MNAVEIASQFVGRPITRIDRVVYEFAGQRQEIGEVQISFGPDVLTLAVADNAETMRAVGGPWHDPFEGAIDENLAYFTKYGRALLVDVSNDPRYRPLIGSSIQRVLPITNKFGRVIGVRLVAAESTMNVWVNADDVAVTWGEDVPLWGEA